MNNRDWANRKNWYALLICMLTTKSVYQSLDAMGVEREVKERIKTTHRRHNDETVNAVLKARESGHTYKQIGEQLHLSFNSIAYICREYREAEND